MGLYKQKFNTVSGQFNLVPTSTIITFKPGVANAAALPLIGNTLNDGRITADNGHLYIWDGSIWIDSGDIVDLKWAAIEDKPTSLVANIDDAVSKRHTQGTDQGLDTGGSNAVTAAQVKDAVTNSHAPHSDDQVIPDQLSDLADDSTHRLVTDTELSDIRSIPDVLLNVMLNAFRIAQIGSLTIFNMVKGFMDEFVDESGIDTANSINEIYDASGDLYKNSYFDFDSYTKLCLHGDGSDGSQIFVDEMGNTVTANGDVENSTDQAKFGSGSIHFDGTGDYLAVANSSDWDFGSGDFTIDWWEYRERTTLSVSFARSATLDQCAFMLNYDNGLIYMSSDNANWDIAGGKTFGTLPLNQWVHYAIVRNGNTFYTFQNGVQQDTWTSSLALATTTHDLSIGAFDIDGSARYQQGYMDEIRISKGIARWTSDFTPPTSAYGNLDSLNMTLISLPQVATDIPTSARIVIFEADVDSVTLNTDLKAYISRDNGVTYSQVTLEDEGNYISSARILSGVVDLTSQPSGTNIRYKLITDNLKSLEIHGVGLSWKY